MKKIVFPLLFAIAGFVWTGCDDMLDATPKDKLTVETFFTDESQIRAYSIVFYEAFPGSELYVANDDHYTQNKLSSEEMGTRTPPSSGGGWSWGALRNINVLLVNLYRCPDAAVRTKYEALGRFFRAYFYINKVKRFGDVPWYDAPIGSTETAALNRPRDSREFIMNRIVEDLDFAIEHLPEAHSTYEVTKWTAMALKSRALLFEGTFRKYHENDVFLKTLPADAKPWTWYLEQCAEVSRELIQTSGYSLHTDGGVDKAYFNLFHTMNATDLSDEVILARDYNAAYNVRHSSGATMTTGSRGCPSVTKKLIASYLMKDGTRFTDKPSWTTMSFFDECQNRDPRLAQSIRTPGYRRMGEEATTSPDFLVTFTGYHPDKYVTYPDQDVNEASEIDLIIFRMAEIYLNYAEALAELGQLSQADLNISINKLRQRVGMPELVLADAIANPDDFLTNEAYGGYQSPVLLQNGNKGIILEIRRERGIELAQEGHRYYDLMRWKEGKAFNAPFYGIYLPGIGVYDVDQNGTNDYELYPADGKATQAVAPSMKLDSDVYLSEGAVGFIWLHKTVDRKWDEERDYLYPIPTDDRNLTGGALTQNPGWKDGLNF